MPVTPQVTNNVQPQTAANVDPECSFMSEEGKHSGVRNCGYTTPGPTEYTYHPPSVNKGPVFHQPDTMTGTGSAAASASAGIQCIDNIGSHNDVGYLQGYADGQRDFRASNGFDNSLHQHHTNEFIQGYKNGYQQFLLLSLLVSLLFQSSHSRNSDVTFYLTVISIISILVRISICHFYKYNKD